MKLDWTLMRAILAHVEAETIEEFLRDTEKMTAWKEGQLLSKRIEEKTPPEVRVVLRHVKLLADAGYIEGVQISESLDGFFEVGIGANPALTLSGYSLLESLRTDGFIDKLKAYAKAKAVPFTVETLKAISVAAIPKFLN